MCRGVAGRGVVGGVWGEARGAAAVRVFQQFPADVQRHEREAPGGGPGVGNRAAGLGGGGGRCVAAAAAGGVVPVVRGGQADALGALFGGRGGGAAGDNRGEFPGLAGEQGVAGLPGHRDERAADGRERGEAAEGERQRERQLGPRVRDDVRHRLRPLRQGVAPRDDARQAEDGAGRGAAGFARGGPLLRALRVQARLLPHHSEEVGEVKHKNGI